MKRFKDILFVVEPNKVYSSDLERAVTLAVNNQANLTVVTVIPSITAGIGMPDGGPISNELRNTLVNRHKQELDTLAEPYRKRIKIETRVLPGTTHFLEIIREILRNGHDLVIKTAEQCDWWDRWFGSDDMHLLRKSPVPVWLIKPQAPKTYRRILAALDLNDYYPEQEIDTRYALKRKILEMASTLALSEFAELHIGSAWEPIGESAMFGDFKKIQEEISVTDDEGVKGGCEGRLVSLIDELASYVGQDALDYLKPQTHLIKGGPRKEIPALAKQVEADLIVMGTVSRTGIPGFFMGNTAEAILSQIDCSVLAIKPPGFITPVTLEE